MKKITRSILISGIVILSSCGTKDCCEKTAQEVYEYEGLTMSNHSTSEIVNTVEDMIEWIIEDVASGYVDSTRADTYIDNLEQIIKEVSNE